MKNNIKKHHLLIFLAGIAVLISLNIISNAFHFRIDLTQEKRYTLSETTKETLKNLDDVVYIKVYLEGDFPAGFKRLRNSTMELLDEFRAYTDNIQYDFINPNESSESQERNDTYMLLAERGLKPTDLQVNTDGGMKQQIIFPGALVNYNNHEIPVQLLANQMGIKPEEVLNNSIQNLEFAFVTAINELTTPVKAKIGILTGHGELAGNELADIIETLQQGYSIEVANLDGHINALTERYAPDTTKMDEIKIRNKYDVVIVPKPDSTFSEQDKFILDQYVMRGGNVLWLIDPVVADMDSLDHKSMTYAIPKNMNLEDMFFNYGVRLNPDLLMDKNCLPIVMVTGRMGDQPQFGLVPWYFFPLATPSGEHPMTRNLNAVKTNFASSIDTIEVAGIKKTILLTTSDFSRKMSAPVRVDLGITKIEPERINFNERKIPVAVLVEGKFNSLFKGRVPAALRNNTTIDFKEKSKDAKMIFVSDGDIIRNSFDRKSGYVLPLGYDQDTRQTFGNKDFLLNAINYLTDDKNLIDIRSREVKIRLLDATKVKNERVFWQLLNVIAPIALVLIFGLISYQIRKRKYTKS